jgi:hypothetical protein
MHDCLKIPEHWNCSLHQRGKMPRRERAGRDEAWKSGGGPTSAHLVCRNQQQQSCDDRDARSDSNHGQQQHDHAERAFLKALRQPVERKMICRQRIVQSLQ